MNTPPGGTVYRLPRSHWHCTLASFQWRDVRPSTCQASVAAFVEELRLEGDPPPHLLLTGPPGVGKTHLGVALYRVATVLWGPGWATWLHVPEFCEKVKRSYNGGDDPWEDVEAARRLVVLDDLFGKEFTGHEVGQILPRLLDTAQHNGAGMVVTMNPGHEELPSRLTDHEISRLLAHCTVIPMKAGRDWRRG